MSSFHFRYSEAPPGAKLERADMVRIGRLLLPTWGTSLLVLLCILATSLLGLVPPILTRDVIDHALPSGDRRLLVLLVAAMIGAPLVAGLVGVLQNWLVTVMGHGVMFGLRNQMYDRLLRQSLRFFTDSKAGDIHSRLQNDVGGVQGVVTGTLVALVSNGLVVTTAVAFMLWVDWRLTLIAMAILPAFILPTRKVGQLRRRLSKQTQERLSELTSYIHETLSVSGFLIVRLFGAREHARQRFAEKAGAVRDLQIQQNNVGRWFLMWVILFSSVGPAIIFLVGGFKVIEGRLTVGTIIMFVGYLGRLYGPVSALINAHVEVMSGAALFRRIFEYLDLPIEVAEPAQPVRLAHPRGELRFEGVFMSHAGGLPTLQDVSFEALPGQMVALVGPSGAGKTTVTYLACRLHDPVGGRVTFDGIDLRDLSLDDLSRWTANVTQETTLFNATVIENLRYGRMDASMEEVERACRLAQIHDMVAALPQGYDTVVGERGYKLSGGEKQRLALARVVLRDPLLLILDEATSSLDSQSEALIQRALEPLLEGRTSLVIAHRLGTILRADLILVLDRGRIVERGTHAELLAREGLYARLHAQQFRSGAETGGVIP